LLLLLLNFHHITLDISLSSITTTTMLLKNDKQKTRGAFVVLEGVDRCGKTTQSAALLKKLMAAGMAAAALRFPDRTTQTGKLIDSYLQSSSNLDDRAVHLLFSANRWEAADHLTEQLASGTNVVCDRYAYSGVAFSSAKVKADGVTPRLPLDWCQAPDIGLPAPDCVIFLDLSPADAESRGGYGGERYEKRDMQVRVRQRFSDLQKMDEAALTTTDEDKEDGDDKLETRVPWHLVDAAQSVAAVESDIWAIVQATLEKVQEGKPVYKMWQEGTYEWNVEEKEN
jgi:dTMP kinase